MAILETDIKLLKAERMNDTSDGGGAMTANVVQSGVDNNIFDDVSTLDRVYGNVSLRKVFGAVLTNNVDKYLGARVIIDKPPADPYIESTLFSASSLFDIRDQAKARVEAYLAPGSPYQGLLYGPHIVGMRVVSLIQQTDRPVPAIGEVFILRKGIDTISQTEQFVRVTGVTHNVLSFTDANGDFSRRVVVCDISDALRYDFPGWEAIRIDAGLDYTGKTRMFESVVADAAQYYGIRPLAEDAAIGDFTIQADSAYSQLLPSAQVETPIADASASGYALASQPVGNDFTYTLNATLSVTQKLFIGAAIAHGTLSIQVPGQPANYTDDGDGNLVAAGVPIGAVDYANGVVTLSNNTYQFSDFVVITYKVTATPSLVLRSTGILITLENRSLSYVQTLASTAAPGTMTVSYMVSGQWYVLRDNGSGGLSADEAGFGAGNVNYVTATLTVTLGALPDVGSTIVIQWGEKQAMIEFGTADLKYDRAGFTWTAPQGPAVLSTGDVDVTWSFSGSNFGASISGGVVSGDGDIYPVTSQNGAWTGSFVICPDRTPPANTQFTIGYKASTLQSLGSVAVLGFTYGGAVQAKTANILGVEVTALFTVSGTINEREVYFFGSTAMSGLYQVSWGFNGITMAGNVTVQDTGDGTGVMSFGYYTNGAGWTRINVGTLDRATGAVVISGSTVGGADIGGPDVYIYDPGAQQYVRKPWSTVPIGNRSVTFTINAQNRVAQYTPQGGSTLSATVTPSAYKLLLDVPAISGQVFRSLSFTLYGKKYTQDLVNAALLLADQNPLTGVGTTVGGIDVNTGEVTITTWPTGGPDSLVTGFAAAQVPTSELAVENNKFLSSEITFRTPTAPLRPGGFSVLGTMINGTTFNLSADANGKIDGTHVAGVVNYQTGVCRLWAKETRLDWQRPDLSYPFSGYYAQVLAYSSIYLSLEGFRTATIRYNAVAFTYLPLDAAILGLDPVRLPSDGRVPVFKSGRVVVLHNTQSTAPATVSNGTVVNTGRTLLARIRVFGSDGIEVTTGFTKNLDAGTVTFTNVAGIAQPVTVEHRIEDEALCADAQINGQLRLTRPLTHAYTQGDSYVSSAFIQGTLQGLAQATFSQEAWTGVWSDGIIGNPILAQYNDTAFPIVVTNAGAITENWAVIFTSTQDFRLVGKEVGQILTGSIGGGADIAPVNPATGVPYFTLSGNGWGSGWAAGNVLRFNTLGANFPLWVARTVLQSPTAPPGSDQMTISIRGDIDQ